MVPNPLTAHCPLHTAYYPMTEADILQLQIDRCQRYFAAETHRDLANRAVDLVHAAAAAGGDLTLNPTQVSALSRRLELSTAVAKVRQLKAGVPPELKIVPFNQNAKTL